MTSESPPDHRSYGLEGIHVSLDDADGAFLAGQQLTGRIIVSLVEPIRALGIQVRCKGEARIHFTERSVGIRRKFSADESYVHLEHYVAGDGKTATELSSGSYQFALGLPDNLPCSFEGLYGRIRYSLRASLVLQPDLMLHSPLLPFSLVSISDLNRHSLAPLPISESQTKTFIGQREPLRIELELPVRGFVPGQTVPMQITLNNESNVRVAKIRIVLKKIVTYHGKEKSRRHKEIVIEIELAVTRQQETFHEEFDVPSVPPSGMEFCSLLDVCYALKVEALADLGEWYYRMLQKNPKIRTSIIIGTVPLDNYDRLVSGDTSHSNGEQYQVSQIYRSSKPDKDDPTGDEGDSDGAVSPYSPMYRVYQFEKSKK